MAEGLVRRAAAAGAKLVVLPEKWHYIDDSSRLRHGAEPLDGPSVEAVRGWAREHGVAIVAGSGTGTGSAGAMVGRRRHSRSKRSTAIRRLGNRTTQAPFTR